jgi:hypothetical protein
MKLRGKLSQRARRDLSEIGNIRLRTGEKGVRTPTPSQSGRRWNFSHRTLDLHDKLTTFGPAFPNIWLARI